MVEEERSRLLSAHLSRLAGFLPPGLAGPQEGSSMQETQHPLHSLENQYGVS